MMKRAAALLLLVALAPAADRDFEAKRKRAIERGLDFIYKTACDAKNFSAWGHDYLWCFYCIASTSRDAKLGAAALRMGRERAAVWRREHPDVPGDADADDIGYLAFGSYAADRLGLPDERLKVRIARAAPRFPVKDFLLFDPAVEPPPSDVPESCSRCKFYNARGVTICRRCGSKTTFRSRYGVWYDALITAYSGDKFGVTLGAPFSDVFRWRSAMLPYRGSEGGRNPDYDDTVYAVTHVVYTSNDYSTYRLSPRRLPEEFAFLKANLKEAITQNDPETMGEFLDSLRAFGLGNRDPLIRSGMQYLLSTQNADGSWGETDTSDIYARYHPTWTAVDGLRDYIPRRAR